MQTGGQDAHSTRHLSQCNMQIKCLLAYGSRATHTAAQDWNVTPYCSGYGDWNRNKSSWVLQLKSISGSGKGNACTGCCFSQC